MTFITEEELNRAFKVAWGNCKADFKSVGDQTTCMSGVNKMLDAGRAIIRVKEDIIEKEGLFNPAMESEKEKWRDFQDTLTSAINRITRR